jgi:hypothetical protein
MDGAVQALGVTGKEALYLLRDARQIRLKQLPIFVAIVVK